MTNSVNEENHNFPIFIWSYIFMAKIIGTVKLRSLELGWLELIWKSRQFSLYF